MFDSFLDSWVVCPSKPCLLKMSFQNGRERNKLAAIAGSLSVGMRPISSDVMLERAGLVPPGLAAANDNIVNRENNAYNK